MKKIVVTVSFFLIVFLALNAQNPSQRPINIKGDTISGGIRGSLPDNTRKIDTAEVQVPNIYAWKITPRLGERIFIPRDTATIDFHQTMLVDGQSVAMGYLGNVGSPAQSKIFFDRPEASRFTFSDAMYLWRKGPGDHYFLNTKIPYSNVKYQSGGGGERAENRFQGEITMNMGRKLNVGFDFDYVYSRGFYNSLSNKQVIYDVYASYIGDKYKMHAYIHNNNFKNIENGGIENPIYITNPNSDSIRSFSGKSKDIPVRMENTWNHMRGRHIYVTNRYDLGNDMEEYPVNDSTIGYRKKKDYVPLASAILTTHYNDQRRRFKSTDSNLDKLYEIDGKYSYNGEPIANPLYTDDINDYMSYYSFKNTLALAMNEGFRKWTKFGLTVFAEYDLRKYSLPLVMTGIEGSGELPSARPDIQTHKTENSFIIGGVLSKEKGKYLRYRASGEYDFLQSDFKLEGELTTMLKIAGKDFSVKANAYIKNTTPSFFDRHFVSKYWSWNNDPTKAEQDANPNLKKLGHIRRVYAGGEINFPKLSFSETKISGGVEILKNYVYYDAQGLPTQKGDDDILVYSLRLDQKLHYGILHWDNQIVFQHTGDSKVIPLPDLSVYSNLYITSKIAKVLTFQLGVDTHIHSKYYVPGYQPLTMQFYNQQDMRLGCFPVATAYVNLHLKYTRFFIMMYNVADGMFNSESFSLYRYPVNSRVLKLGISWQFNN